MKNIASCINKLAKKREPFLFILDFNAENIQCFPLPIDSKNLAFKFPNHSNVETSKLIKQPHFEFTKTPLPYSNYQKSFEIVKKHIRRGDTFLLNLTMPTPIRTSLSLEEIFYCSNAMYKLLIPNHFVVFSPEIFIRINNNTIRSYPMKGTIDASIPDAETIIINDSKEIDEHHTIVDLIRNDLNKVSKRVRVERFRYIDRIKTNTKELLQVSSEICGDLEPNWQNQLGDILVSLLPAGSISGAPKQKTLQIIHEVEPNQRGFYTGIAGVFDGNSVDAAVMIRFIEQTESGLIYRSGGGITINSDPKSEYQELIDKIYVPLY